MFTFLKHFYNLCFLTLAPDFCTVIPVTIKKRVFQSGSKICRCILHLVFFSISRITIYRAAFKLQGPHLLLLSAFLHISRFAPASKDLVSGNLVGRKTARK